jgi:hypothetical protein
MLISLPRPDDFIHFAVCGLFAYDWRDVHRTRGFSNRYEMLARPDAPICVSELPERFQSLLRSTVLLGVRFTDSLTIDVRGHFRCEPTA